MIVLLRRLGNSSVLLSDSMLRSDGGGEEWLRLEADMRLQGMLWHGADDSPYRRMQDRMLSNSG